jgi:hypothetical protein
MYDIIGDVHGHEAALRHLLARLGYREHLGHLAHPSRQAIFVGDIVDRGPRIRETLALIRSMVEAGAAQCVLGNHELNALGYHTPSRRRPGDYMRSHSLGMETQHAETIRQVPEQERRSHLAWLRTLPLWLTLEGIRVVHACWDDEAISFLTSLHHMPMQDDFLEAACDRDNPIFKATKTLIRGKKVELPNDIRAWNHAGNPQTKARIRWYLDPRGKTFGEYLMPAERFEGDAILDEATIAAARPYASDAPPVFFGHYRMTGASPHPLSTNVACLDWSGASAPTLCAYRWSGEPELVARNFTWVPLV